MCFLLHLTWDRSTILFQNLRVLNLGTLKIADIDSIATTNEMSPDSLRALIEEDMSPYKVRDTLYTNYFDENLTKEVRKAQSFQSSILRLYQRML